jgi:hypothetical protein
VSVICGDVGVLPALNLPPIDVSYWQDVVREFSQICSNPRALVHVPRALDIRRPNAICGNSVGFGGKVPTHRPANCAMPPATVA